MAERRIGPLRRQRAERLGEHRDPRRGGCGQGPAAPLEQQPPQRIARCIGPHGKALAQREHPARGLGFEAETVDRAHGNRDMGRGGEVSGEVVEGDLDLARGDDKHLNRVVMAMRGDLPVVQCAAGGDRLDMAKRGRLIDVTLAIEAVGGN